MRFEYRTFSERLTERDLNDLGSNGGGFAATRHSGSLTQYYIFKRCLPLKTPKE